MRSFSSVFDSLIEQEYFMNILLYYVLGDYILDMSHGIRLKSFQGFSCLKYRGDM